MQQQRLHDQERAAILSLSGRDYEDAETAWEDGEMFSSQSASASNKRASLSCGAAPTSSHKDGAQLQKGGPGKGSQIVHQRRPESRQGVHDTREQEALLQDPLFVLLAKNQADNLRAKALYMREAAPAARNRLRPDEDAGSCRAMLQLPVKPTELGSLHSARSAPLSSEACTIAQGSQANNPQPRTSDWHANPSLSVLDGEVKACSKSGGGSNRASPAATTKSRAQMLASLNTLLSNVSPLSGGVPVAVEDMNWMERCSSPKQAWRADKRPNVPRIPSSRGGDGESLLLRGAPICFSSCMLLSGAV